MGFHQGTFEHALTTLSGVWSLGSLRAARTTSLLPENQTETTRGYRDITSGRRAQSGGATIHICEDTDTPAADSWVWNVPQFK